jgi:hypothetical protein
MSAVKTPTSRTAHQAGYAAGLRAAARHARASDVPVPIEKLIGSTKREVGAVVALALADEIEELAAIAERAIDGGDG